MRAGCGTQIKISEAFAYGVPVVNHTIGAGEFDARDGEHLLGDDTPKEIARTSPFFGMDRP